MLASAVTSREAGPELWAKVEALRGRALGQFALRVASDTGAQLTREGVAALQNASEFYTRERSIENWAMLQGNLSSLLGIMANHVGGAEATNLLNAAVECSEGALTYYTWENSPVNRAAELHNMGLLFRYVATRLSGRAPNRGTIRLAIISPSCHSGESPPSSIASDSRPLPSSARMRPAGWPSARHARRAFAEAPAAGRRSSQPG